MPKVKTVSKLTIPLVNPHWSNHKDYEAPLVAFFAEYRGTGFEYNPAASATAEFHRLCRLNGWGKNLKGRQVAKRAAWQGAKQGFQDALTMQFNDSYGTDENDLTNWQTLCARLGMDPVPESLNACRRVRKMLKSGLLINQGCFRPSETRTSILSILSI